MITGCRVVVVVVISDSSDGVVVVDEVVVGGVQISQDSVVVGFSVKASMDAVGGEPISTGATGGSRSAGIEGMDGCVGKPPPSASPAPLQGNPAD